MFDSLDEQIRKDEDRVSSGKERMMMYLLYIVLTLIVFGALYYGVHLMNGA